MARKAIPARYCPICGEQRFAGSIETLSMDGDEDYQEWHHIECRACGSEGAVDFEQPVRQTTVGGGA